MGLEVAPLDTKVKWHFIPRTTKGELVTGGSILGSVPEKLFDYKIFVPFSLHGNFTVESIASKGEYTIQEEIATI